MTTTINFDQKFDLENGELRIRTIADLNDIYSEVLFYSIDDYGGDGEIDNSGNTTILTFPYDITDDYFQFGYFVNDELIKATKFIPNDIIKNSNAPVNISDVEVLCFALKYDSVGGFQYVSNEETYEQDDNCVELCLFPFNAITILPSYTDEEDYDLSEMYIKLYITYFINENYDEDIYEYVTQLKNFEKTDYGYIINLQDIGLDTTCDYIGTIECEFISPGVVTNRGYFQQDH